jgi:hypothetical protein
LPWRVERLVGHLLPQVRRTRLRVPGGDLLGHGALLEDFVAAVTIGRDPGVSGVEGLHDLAAVLAGYQARESGAAVALKREQQGDGR